MSMHVPMENKIHTFNSLTDHWMLDEFASMELATIVNSSEARDIVDFDALLEGDTKLRNRNRKLISNILDRTVDMNLAIVGPCSWDSTTKVEEFGEFLMMMQERHPNTLIAARINGAKPRTKGGWTGSGASLRFTDRHDLIHAMMVLNAAGVPVVSEVTEPTQFGSFGPFLSGMWLGARDIESTSLRSMASITRLPVLFKNGRDGNPETVENAIIAAGKSSAETSSAVDIGTIARLTFPSRGVPTGHLTVASGNKNVGIIARGHDISGEISSDQRRQIAIGHLGTLCSLAERLGTSVIIDGSHDVPKMLDVPRSQEDRFPRVMSILLDAIESGDVEDAGSIKGVMCEISTNVGRTDPNWIINNKSINQLGEIISRIEEL